MRFVGECCVDLCVRAANRHILWTFVLYWKAWVVVVLISWSMPPSRSVRFCRRYVVVAWLVKAPVNSNAKQRLSQRKKGDESTRGHKELGFACAAVAMARERELSPGGALSPGPRSHGRQAKAGPRISFS
jgi:hypothetical protein